MATRYKPGLFYMDYTSASDVTAGTVIPFPAIVCVADVDLKAGVLDAIAIGGIYSFPKVAATEMLQGSRAYWDTADGEMNVDNANVIGGVVMEDAGSAATTVLVRINT